MPSEIFKCAGGEILIWVDLGGAIMLKVAEPFADPVELGEEEALELSALLRRLVGGEDS